MILSTLENKKRVETESSDVIFDCECDLLCVGIGAAGGYAALAAAREGISVIAVEKDANVGGMPVNGRVTFYYYGFGGGSFERNDEKDDERTNDPSGDPLFSEVGHNCFLSHTAFCRDLIKRVTFLVGRARFGE